MADIWLAGPVTTTAFGWRLERRDGVTLGFTSHDQDHFVDGLTYRASPGLVPGSIVEKSGLDVTTIDIRGALSSDSIRHEDLVAGKWDGATVDAFLFDWNSPDHPVRPLASGKLGSIEFSEGRFIAEVEGAAAGLSIPVAPYTSPTCRARFCDSQCGLNHRRFSHRVSVNTVSGDEVTVSSPSAFAPANFIDGQLRWLNGPNAGIRQSVIGLAQDRLILDRPPSFAVASPAFVELLEGCDKHLATCNVRFGNSINFRGEPHLPGNDLLTRFPGA